MAASVELVFVISDLGSGGAQRVLTTLANAWADRGRRIAVITLADEASDFFCLHPAIQRIVIGGLRQSRNPLEAVWMNLRRILALRRSLRQCGAKIVVSFVGTTNLLTIMAATGLGLRRIISERNDPARQSLGRSWDWLRRRLYRYADIVTANSWGVLDTLSDFVPACQIAYVPNPVAIPPIDDENGARQLIVLSVGRLHPQKAYDILIPAFAEASAIRAEWRLEILGEGPLLASLQDLAEKQGVARRVIWRGRVENALSFYQTASIFVLASRHEGTPNAMLEAMACGLPVVVSDASPGPLEYIEDGVTGLVVPVENTRALANALRRLMDDNELRSRLGQKAKERVADCELSKAIQIWEQVIEL